MQTVPQLGRESSSFRYPTNTPIATFPIHRLDDHAHIMRSTSPIYVHQQRRPPSRCVGLVESDTSTFSQDLPRMVKAIIIPDQHDDAGLRDGGVSSPVPSVTGRWQPSPGPSPVTERAELLKQTASPIADTLRTFEAECHDLLSLLEQQQQQRNGKKSSSSETATSSTHDVTRPSNRSNSATHPLEAREQPAAQSSITSADGTTVVIELLVKWALFLMDSRLSQLERLLQHSTDGDRLGRTVASAALAAHEAREGIQSLKPSAASAPDRRQVCTVVSNSLAEMVHCEDDALAGLLNRVVASQSADGQHASSQHPAAQSSLCADVEEYRAELCTAAELMRQLKEENVSLHKELADMHKKREKTKRHLARERSDKDTIARHFDALAADNAELHRRLQQLQIDAERGSSSRAAAEMCVQESLHRSEEGTAAVQAVQEEYNRLKAQMDRQHSNVNELRTELLDAERENDTLRNTVGQLRQSLVRHRSVIELLTRKPEPDAAATADGGGGGPHHISPQLIADLLSGATPLEDSYEHDE